MKDKLLKWKAEFGTIYNVVLEEKELYYRTLTTWEIQSIVELKNSAKAAIDVELATCLMSTLYPEPLPSFEKPGTISTLATAIWDNSVPSERSLEQVVQTARSWADTTTKENFGIALASIMCRVLPSLDFAYLLNLPAAKLIKLAAVVELITDNSFMAGENSSTKNASPVTPGHGVSQEQADSASTALTAALSNFKKDSNIR